MPYQLDFEFVVQGLGLNSEEAQAKAIDALKQWAKGHYEFQDDGCKKVNCIIDGERIPFLTQEMSKAGWKCVQSVETTKTNKKKRHMVQQICTSDFDRYNMNTALERFRRGDSLSDEQLNMLLSYYEKLSYLLSFLGARGEMFSLAIHMDLERLNHMRNLRDRHND